MINKARILIVEDETIVALDTKSTLKKLDYEVTDIVTNYEDTVKSIEENLPDIILMDIFLKNSIDGIEIAKKINETKTIPVIFISAYCDDKTISRAVEVEPIGYLVKPFNRNELKTTINLASYKLAKSKSINNNFNTNLIEISHDYYYRIDDYLKLYYKEQEIILTKNERLLLELLIKAKGEIVSFTSIEHYIWCDKPISDSTFRTLLYRLRSKFDYRLIETVTSVGCRIVFSNNLDII